MYINLPKLTYANSTAIIKIYIGVPKTVKILRGVLQGDILSDLLFCIVMAAVVSKLESECSSGFSISGQ